jgi:hypothetical protein
MGKLLFTISLGKPRYEAETILKTYDLFIYIDTYYITNQYGRNVPEIAIS